MILNAAPLSMIEGAFLNTLGFLWLSHGLCLQRLFDGKSLMDFLKSVIAYALATKADLCREKSNVLAETGHKKPLQQLGVNYMAYPLNTLKTSRLE